ncbi:MAG: DUF6473 family protein [Caulobacterales bacterium]
MTIWHPNYQPRDWNLIDYQEFKVKGCDIPFRGPGFDPFAAAPGSYFTCIGAAQTYGCFYPRPYPTILSEAIGMPALNLAVGGTGPGLYTQFQSLIEAMNRGRFVVLQCMSGRSESNALYEANGYVEFVKERETGKVVTSSEAWHRIVGEGVDFGLERVQESRESWIATSHRLLGLLKVPVIFFWYSRRGHDYSVDKAAIDEQMRKRAAGEKASFFVDGLVGEYPQLINEKTMRAVADKCTAYAECVSSRGMGQKLVDRFTGGPFKTTVDQASPEYNIDYSTNSYYPSAEMHEDAADALQPVIERLLK